MTRFSATNESEATVAVEPSAIWKVLTDPVVLPQLTPLLRRIDTDGDLWRWHLSPLSVLGVWVGTTFTERMRFEESRRIEYWHEPPRGVTERTGAEGFYELTDVPDGTHLAISITLSVELPISRLVAPAVTSVMDAAMQRTGERFSANLLRHLGVSGS